METNFGNEHYSYERYYIRWEVRRARGVELGGFKSGKWKNIILTANLDIPETYSKTIKLFMEILLYRDETCRSRGKFHNQHRIFK